MKNFFLSIKTQLIFTFITISTIIILVVTYFNFITNIDQEKNSFIQNSLIQANLLADFTVSPLVFSDKDGAKENLDKLKNDKNIQRVIIFDNDRKTFAQYNPNNMQEPIKDIKYPKIILEDKNNEFLNYGILKITVPLKHKDEIYGILYLEKSTEIITQLLRKVFRDVLIFTFFLLIFIYFISIILSNYLLKPILFLASSTEEIASTQNYSTRVEYNSENEIGSLYKAFNKLLKDTENLTNTLEEKVSIRTNELNLKTQELELSLRNLKETQQQLIESEKMSALGNLVSGIAHEVNTPLGNAITSSSIIEKETSYLIKEFDEGTLKRSTMEKKLLILNESTKLLNKTLNYASGLIKSFKQISVDQVTNDIRIFNIKQYIDDIFLTNHNKLKLIPVKIQIISEEDIMVKTSPGVIAQIFNNLIQNSIIHGFEDFKAEAKISVILETQDEYLIIKYIDNGCGINFDIKNKIFEPFITTKRNAGGTGIGLNIVYNLICQKLKGTIEVKSEENIETTFTIKIPLIYSSEEKK